MSFIIDTSNNTTNNKNNNTNNISYGFIITRNVIDNKTNRYWNTCVTRLRYYYPYTKIVIIDDNSKPEFLESFQNYSNIEIIESEYKGRGELLPYYYFYTHKWFSHAVIIHDSVFFHKRVAFEKLINYPVMPLWHFKPDKDNVPNLIRIASKLTNNSNVINKINFKDDMVSLFEFENRARHGWNGCFGVQSFISHNFISLLQKKYNVFNMLDAITCRADRCGLERVISILFFEEYKNLEKIHSLFGDIFKYQKFGYSYENYLVDLKKGIVPRYVVKVWTGR